MKCKTETSVIIDSTYNDDENSTIVDPAKTGKFIKLLRSKHNLSQQALADQLYLSRKAVSKWENGRCCPSTDTLKILSKIFNVSLEELLNGRFNVVPDEYLPLHKRIIKKIISNKTFQTISIIVAVVFIGCLLSFYYTHKDGEKYYEMTVNTDIFSMAQSYIYYKNNSYTIIPGTFTSYIYLSDDEVTYTFKFYIKTNNNKTYNVFSQKAKNSELLKTTKISDDIKNIISKNMNNFYVDLSCETKDGTVEYNGIKITVKESNSNTSIKNVKSKLALAPFDLQSDKVKSNSTEDQNLRIDISKLDNLYEKLLKLNTENLSINYNETKFYIKLYDDNKINLFTKDLIHNITFQDDGIYIRYKVTNDDGTDIISIKNDYIVFNNKNSHYYALVKTLVDQLIALSEPEVA